MAKVSLSKASKDTGVHVSTLSRWREKGKISAEKNPDDSGYLIDTSEYDRINILRKNSSRVQPPANGSMRESASMYATPLETPKNELVETLKEQVTYLKKKLDESTQSEAQLRDIIKQQNDNIKLLSPPKSSPPAPDIEKQPETESKEAAKKKKKFDWYWALMLILALCGGLIVYMTYLYGTDPEAATTLIDKILSHRFNPFK